MHVRATRGVNRDGASRDALARFFSASLLGSLLFVACDVHGPTAPGTLASLVVTPAQSTLFINDTQQYVAVGYDAEGRAVEIAPEWSVVAAGGAISATGVFRAGSTPGSYPNTVRATSGGLAGHASVTVNAGPLASITVIPDPVTLPVGDSRTFTAICKDAGGNVVSCTPVWSVVAGGGSIGPGGLFTAGGVPGTYANTVRAASGLVMGTASVTVTAGVLASITVTPDPATLPVAGTQLFSAVGRDARGNVVAITPTWSVAAGGGTISAAGAFVAGRVPGTYPHTVTATSGGLTGTATVIVTAGALATITVTPTPVTLAIGGTQTFTAVGRDESGNVVAFVPTWSVVAGGGAISAAGAFTSGVVPGTFANTVQAASGGVAGHATVTVVEGTVAAITVTPNPVTVPVQGTQSFTAVATDAGGNILNVTPTWAVVAGGGTIGGDGLFTAGTTLGTFANTVTATSGGVTGSATVTVGVGALASITVTPPEATLAIGGVQQFRAVGTDAGGNPVAFTPVWTVLAGGGSIGVTGAFTAGFVTGTFAHTVQASSGSVAGTASVVVVPGALAAIAVTPDPVTLGIGGTQQFTAVGTDAGGNVVSIAPSWLVVAGGGTISAAGLFTAGTTPGTFTGTVTATSGTITADATVTVTSGVLASITVTPNPVTLAIGGTHLFTATGTDAGGNAVAVTPVWTVVAGGATISAAGLLTAGTTPGTYVNTVQATSGGVSGRATITVTSGTLAAITITPSTVTLPVNGTQAYTAVGTDDSGNVVAISPVWNVAAGGGAISPAGLFTAGTAPGTYANTVTATSGTITATATVTVTTGTLARITITPNPQSLAINGTRQFVAVGTDASGNVVPLAPVWSMAAGGGVISATGLFTAGTVPGTFTNTVTATSGGVTGTATVTVTAGALATVMVTPNPQALAINGTQQFSAVGRDAGGNVVAITPAWSVVAGGGAITGAGLFTAGVLPGTFTNTIRASSGGVVGLATVTVATGVLATVTVTPATVSLAINGTQQYGAVGRDAGGNVVPITPVWSVAAGGGVITGAALFTAGTTPGVFANTVTATVGAIVGRASVTVTAGAVATITVTPNPRTLPISGTQAFTAVGRDAGGNVVAVTPTWSVAAGGGAITGAGLFTAGTVPGTFTNSITASSGGISGTATVTVTTGPLASLTVSPNLTTLGINATQQFTAVGRDAGGNIVASAASWSVVAGGGTIGGSGLFTAGTIPGTFTGTVTATSGGVTGAATVTVTTGALATIVVAPSAVTLAIGGTQQYTAVGRDGGGNVVALTPAWTVVAGGGAIGAGGLFTAGSTPGAFPNTVMASSGGIFGTATVTVTAGALATITVSPAMASLPISGTQPFTAVGRDAGGNVVAITPVWTIAAGGGAIDASGTFTAGTVPGTFTNTVTATSGGVAGTASATITAGPLATLTLAPNPVTVAISATQQFTVVGRDAGGNVLSVTPAWSIVAGGGTISAGGLFTAGTTPGTFTNTVTATSAGITGTATLTVTPGALATIVVTPGTVTLPISGTQSYTAVGRDAGGNVVALAPTWSVAAGGGAITAAGLFTAGTTAGSFSNTVTASSGGISGAASVTVTTGVLAAITVSPSTVTLPASVARQFTAVGTDAGGNVVAISPTWSVVAGGGAIDAAGLFTAGAVTGTFANTVQATSGGITGRASVTVTAGVLASITVTPAVGVMAITGTQQFTAVGRDAGGNVVAITPAWSTVAGGGTIGVNGLFTAGTTPGTFTGTVLATSGGITGAATVTITAGPLATVVVSPGAATLPISGTQQYAAVGRDAAGNVVAITPTWLVTAGGGAISGTGAFTAGTTPGTFAGTVQATSGGIVGTASVTVTTGALATITVSPGTVTLPTAGTQAYAAVGRDAGGNVVALTPSWSVAAGGGSITGTGVFSAGLVTGTFANTIMATSGAISGTASVTVIAGALAAITVTPHPAALTINGTQQFTAVGTDAGGNVVAVSPTWSVAAGGGTIGSAGLFTAGTTPGTYANTVTATSGGITGTATVTVATGPLATITLSPTSVTLAISAAQQFTAVGRDAGGNVLSIAPAWAVVASGGAVTGTGLFTAGVVPGTFTNTVQATSGGVTGTATVTVTTGPLSTITVSPDPQTLAINGAQQFTAVGRDAGGNVVTMTPSWAVVAGGGTISGSGLFTAGTLPGTFIGTVQATSGTVTGTATVAVTAGTLASITVAPNPTSLGITLTQQFTAVGHDAGGNVVALTPVWAVVAGGGTINATGLFTAGTLPGTYPNTVQVTSGAISGTATVTVTAGPLATISVSPASSSLAINGTQQFTAVGRDAGGNVVAIAPTWTIGVGGGVIDGAGFFTAGTVPGTFTNTVRATSASVTGTATVTVTTGPLATITVAPATATLPISGTQSFTAVGRDAGGNIVALTPVWSVAAAGGTISAAGLFTAGTTPGSFANTVVATSGSIAGTASVTVTTGPLASIAVTPDPVTMAITGTQQFTAVGHDAGGNVVAVAPSWSVAAAGGAINSAGLFTAGTTPGTFANTVVATSGSITGTATVTVTTGPLATIALTPAPATLAVTGTQQFTAVGRDAGGNVVAIAPVWTVAAGGGTISGSGLFTAGTVPGTYANTVVATSGSIAGMASVTVTTGPVATITLAPSSVTLAITATQQFTATGRDAGGNLVTIVPVWSVALGGGSINGSGLFVAGTVPGTYTNTVTATSGGVTGTATVAVVAGALTTVTVSPNPGTLVTNGTLQFSATGADASGNAVAVTPTWSVVAGGGTISGTGLFTGSFSTGTFTNTVKAAAGSIAGFATVVLTASPPAGPSLGAADTHGVLAGSTITCVATGTIGGDASVAPGTAITGFPPCVITGTRHSNDAYALAAQGSLTTVFGTLGSMACNTTISADLGGALLLPGVACGGAVGVTGTVTLDGNGDSNAIFVIRATSTLTTAGSVALINGAKASNVFWWVGTSATLGAGSGWQGNVLAQTSITLQDGTTLIGRALARDGAVTLGAGNTITLP